jgi:hypothetical protein
MAACCSSTLTAVLGSSLPRSCLCPLSRNSKPRLGRVISQQPFTHQCPKGSPGIFEPYPLCFDLIAACFATKIPAALVGLTRTEPAGFTVRATEPALNHPSGGRGSPPRAAPIRLYDCSSAVWPCLGLNQGRVRRVNSDNLRPQHRWRAVPLPWDVPIRACASGCSKYAVRPL